MRVTGSCAVGSAIREINADGSVTCQLVGGVVTPPSPPSPAGPACLTKNFTTCAYGPSSCPSGWYQLGGVSNGGACNSDGKHMYTITCKDAPPCS
jgi:hypothetical protein